MESEQEDFSLTGSGLAFAVGFFFSARMISTLFFVRFLGADASTGAEANLALDIFLLGLVWISSLGPKDRTFKSMLRLPTIRWVLAFLIFSGCSLAWSGTVSLPASIAYWCGLVADVAMVALLFRMGSVTGTSHSLMKGFIWSTCCLALIAWIMPAQYDLRLGDEDFFNANQIGNLCAFAIFLVQYLMRRKVGRWGFVLFFLAVTLLRSLSKTTIVAFVLSESVLLIQDTSMSRKTKVLLTMASISMIFIFWGLFEAYYDVYTTAGNQAETLTGRIGIWAYIVDELPEHPWIGHGFDSMWKNIPPFGPDRFEPRHAENEVLQQLYAYGVAGVVLLIGVYSGFYRQIRRLPRGHTRILFLSILTFVFVRGLAEAEPFDLLLPLWSIVLFSMLLSCEEKRDQETAVVPLSG